jgi:hypothetical protein
MSSGRMISATSSAGDIPCWLSGAPVNVLFGLDAFEDVAGFIHLWPFRAAQETGMLDSPFAVGGHVTCCVKRLRCCEHRGCFVSFFRGCRNITPASNELRNSQAPDVKAHRRRKHVNREPSIVFSFIDRHLDLRDAFEGVAFAQGVVYPLHHGSGDQALFDGIKNAGI